MDKSSDDWVAMRKEAIILQEAGKYQKALPKFKSAITMAEKAGDEQATVDLYIWIIACHSRLEQVSGVECERITEKLTFLTSFSTRKCCVYAIRWRR